MTNNHYRKSHPGLPNATRATSKMFPAKHNAVFKTLEEAALATAAAKRLYPASMIGTLGKAYFLTRKEMACPKGVVSLSKYFSYQAIQ